MANISFVREKSIPQLPPPISESNTIGWVRKNLFSNWLSTLLTILSLYFVYICLRDFIPWAYGGIWSAGSLRECLDTNPDVACFSVIGARWKQLLFGFYPSEEYWRPILTFILLFVSVTPIFSQRFAKYFWFFGSRFWRKR
jgi:general L-amino acid transport system permease protein